MPDSHWDASGEHHGEPHVLVLYAFKPPTGQFDDGKMAYDVEHPSSCGQEDEDRHGTLATTWTCDVQYELDNIDLPFTLKYSGTPITEPGRYRIQSWHARHYIFDFGAYEYDGGIGVLDWDQPLHGRQPLTDADKGEYEGDLDLEPATVVRNAGQIVWEKEEK